VGIFKYAHWAGDEHVYAMYLRYKDQVAGVRSVPGVCSARELQDWVPHQMSVVPVGAIARKARPFPIPVDVDHHGAAPGGTITELKQRLQRALFLQGRGETREGDEEE
jgi:hypothetical protein